ncbi:alpha/beta hydrolase family protein [Chryseobacterium paludis]|uniref:alpha/beta hydrolase family protein n=1 Tax=Chryseobacterium paludis TaxID=2956784 RepID=UPI0021C1E882|nr:prolyl oligopeptidase family serine peptidase [Chryseobacterium paludis]
MKVIKIIYIILLFFFSQFKSQAIKKDRLTPGHHNLKYTIIFQATSPDRKWTVFRKAYEENRDTIVLVNHKDPGIVKQYTGIIKYYFTGRSNLLLVRKNTAELIGLGNNGIIKRWDNLVKTEFLKPLNKFIILRQKEALKKDLELWSEDRMIDRYEDIDRFFIKSKQIFFTRREDVKTLLYEQTKPENPIYSTDKEIVDCMWSGNGESAWLEKHKEKRDLAYINRDHRAFHIRNDIDLDFNVAPLIPIGDGSRFLVSFSYTKAIPEQSTHPDIWHAGDRKLEIKFHGGESEKNVIWEPELHRITTTDNKLSEAMDIGNNSYLISFDPYLKQDYIRQVPDFDFYRYNIKEGKHEFIGNGGYTFLCGSTGRFFLSNPGNEWSLYDVNSLRVKKLKVGDQSNAYFSEDDQFILFEVEGGFLRYQTNTGKLVKISLLKGFHPGMISSSKENPKSHYMIAKKSSYDSKKPLLLKMYDRVNDKTAILSYTPRSGKVITLLAPTRQRIETLEQENNQLLSFTAEDYNVPSYISVVENKKTKVIYKSNPDDKLVSRIHSERISYTNSEGVNLTGILYYPVDYKEGSTYPMIVSLYERQSHFGNQYLRDGLFERTEGLNIRSYLENSYFVFLPDIVFGKSGTGFSALDCVNRALDAISGNKAIDFKKMGLIGHSHGGYEVNFIATHSDKFATYASGAGNSDLIRSYFSYNYQFLKPFYWQFETGQYEMPGSFEDHKELYVQNSPIYNVSKINAPILLWTGMHDKNIDWNQVMEFYIALKRNKKDAIALFYPDEAHGFWKRPNQLDLAKKISDWFDYYLKNGKKAEWMNDTE